MTLNTVNCLCLLIESCELLKFTILTKVTGIVIDGHRSVYYNLY